MSPEYIQLLLLVAINSLFQYLISFRDAPATIPFPERHVDRT